MKEVKTRMSGKGSTYEFFTSADLFQITRQSEIHIKGDEDSDFYTPESLELGKTLSKLVADLMNPNHRPSALVIKRYSIETRSYQPDVREQGLIIHALKVLEESRLFSNPNLVMIYPNQHDTRMYYFNICVSETDKYERHLFRMPLADDMYIFEEAGPLVERVIRGLLVIPGVYQLWMFPDSFLIRIGQMYRWDEVEPKIKRLFNKAFKKHFIYKDISKI